MKHIYFFLVLIFCLTIFGNCNKKPSKGYKFNTPVGYKEVDTNTDGKVDVLKWYLPNEFIALSQHDKDKDGYFEATTYYNFKKLPVRTEVDTNFDGRADRIIWENRAELDTDFDGIPDSYIEAPTRLILEDSIERKAGIKPLEKAKSWFLNPILAPADYRAIIGSGYF